MLVLIKRKSLLGVGGKTFIKIVRQTNDSLALLALRMGDGFFSGFFAIISDILSLFLVMDC